MRLPAGKNNVEHRQMDAFDKIKNTIGEHGLLCDSDAVVVGFSGGPDSSCLLHALWRIACDEDNRRGERAVKIYAAHVNHRIRGKAAEEDEAFAVEFCESLGIPCAVFSEDVPKLAREGGLSEEDAGRRVRYKAFETVKRSLGIPEERVRIAVAQNAEDQAETVLMRIMRGTGLSGLGAMAYLREDGVIRPLLDVTREEVESYCRAQGLKPRTDLTNLEPNYTRNRIRLELLPYMKEHFNGNVVGALNRLARIAREEDRLLQELTRKAIDADLTGEPGRGAGREAVGGAVGGPVRVPAGEPVGEPVEALVREPEVGSRAAWICYPLEKLRGHPLAMRRRVMIELFSRIGLERNVGLVHLEQADRVLAENKTGAAVDFPGGYRLNIRCGMAVFEKKPQQMAGMKRGLRAELEIGPKIGPGDGQEAVLGDGLKTGPEADLRTGPQKADETGAMGKDGPETDLGARSEIGLNTGVALSAEVTAVERPDEPQGDVSADMSVDVSGNFPGDLRNLPPWKRAFDLDTVRASGIVPVLRTRRPGDFIRPLGMKGTKKLQDFFVDKKIPRERRDDALLVCLGSEVIWIEVTGTVSQNFCVRPDTKKILFLRIEKSDFAEKNTGNDIDEDAEED